MSGGRRIELIDTLCIEARRVSYLRRPEIEPEIAVQSGPGDGIQPTLLMNAGAACRDITVAGGVTLSGIFVELDQSTDAGCRGRAAHEGKELSEYSEQAVEYAAAAQQTDSNQHGEQIRDEFDGDVEPLFCAFDEGVVDIDFFYPAGYQEQHDDTE